jgi:hypothetical protein
LPTTDYWLLWPACASHCTPHLVLVQCPMRTLVGPSTLLPGRAAGSWQPSIFHVFAKDD